VIIHNFNVVSVACAPAEANAPLLVDSDAVLAFAVALQRFQQVAGGTAICRSSVAACKTSSLRLARR
jgi:hypothetical protein